MTSPQKMTSFLVTIITIWSPPWLHSLLILLSADVELNPGSKSASTSNISICHWNLNNISAHNYIQLFLLKAYIAIHEFVIICLSEKYLDSSTTSDDDNLVISGYNLIRSDHPSTTNAVVFASITKTFCLCMFSVFNICKNVSISN